MHYIGILLACVCLLFAVYRHCVMRSVGILKACYMHFVRILYARYRHIIRMLCACYMHVICIYMRQVALVVPLARRFPLENHITHPGATCNLPKLYAFV